MGTSHKMPICAVILWQLNQNNSYARVTHSHDSYYLSHDVTWLTFSTACLTSADALSQAKSRTNVKSNVWMTFAGISSQKTLQIRQTPVTATHRTVTLVSCSRRWNHEMVNIHVRLHSCIPHVDSWHRACLHWGIHRYDQRNETRIDHSLHEQLLIYDFTISICPARLFSGFFPSINDEARHACYVFFALVSCLRDDGLLWLTETLHRCDWVTLEK